MDLLDKLAVKIAGGSSTTPQVNNQEGQEELDRLSEIVAKGVKEVSHADDEDKTKTKAKKKVVKHIVVDHVDSDEILSISEILKMDRKSLGDTLSRHDETKSYNEIISKSDAIKNIGQIDTADENVLDKVIPFLNKGLNFGVWAYKARYGIMATMAVYLLILLGVQYFAIKVQRTDLSYGILVDIEQMQEIMDKEVEELQKEVEEKQEEIADKQELYERIAIENRILDDYFEEQMEDSEQQNDQQDIDVTQADQLADQTNQAEQSDPMDAIAEQNEISFKDRLKAREESIRESMKLEDRRRSSRNTQRAGNVTVNYHLRGRYATDPEVPAYLCKGGGKVEVEISVGRDGRVIDASIKSRRSVTDDCLPLRALEAAKNTIFNVDLNAPRKQEGVVTFMFVAQ